MTLLSRPVLDAMREWLLKRAIDTFTVEFAINAPGRLPVSGETRATKPQLRALAQIAALETEHEPAYDSAGFLSVTSRNWPATAAALVRRGWATREEDPGARPDLGEPPYAYRTTRAGRTVLAATPSPERGAAS
jgi:hypothetical protein